jgi:uncharacterized protein
MPEPTRAASMKIQLGGLSEGVHQYQFNVAGADLDIGPGFRRPIVVSATVEKTGNQVFLTAFAEATGTFTCDRCLTEFDAVLTPRYTMVYLFEGAEADRFDRSEVQVIPYSLSVVDITDDVRQTFLLAVPLKLLCSESCKGLCPYCGANWNLASCTCRGVQNDQRWEALKNLRTEN